MALWFYLYCSFYRLLQLRYDWTLDQELLFSSIVALHDEWVNQFSYRLHDYQWTPEANLCNILRTSTMKWTD